MSLISKINIKVLYVIFTLFILSMLIFPVFSLANYAEPLIFGMPFIMVWVLFWIIIEFLGLIVFVKLDKEEVPTQEITSSVGTSSLAKDIED